MIRLRKAQADVGDTLNYFAATHAGQAAGELLEQPLDNLNVLLTSGDFDRIERAWQQLSAKAQALETKFPFRDGGGGASVVELARFLNPQDGDLTKFFNEWLKPYFEEDWTVKNAVSHKFSPEFVSYLGSVRRLRNALFEGGGVAPRVEYEVTLTPVRGSFTTIEIDGNTASTADTMSAMFSWPGDMSGAKITAAPGDGRSEHKSFAGAWGLLRMSEAGGGDGKAAQLNLRWRVGVPVRLTINPQTGNVFQRDLFTGLHAPRNLMKGAK